MFRYICSILLSLGVLVNSAPTWAKARYWPTGIQLGVDVLRPFHYKYYGRVGMQYEFNAFMDFASLILEGDYGWGDITWNGHNTETGIENFYTNKGQYFRVGLNYNLLKDTPDKSMAFLGFRYARSFFKDRLVSKVLYHHSEKGDSLMQHDGPTINSKQDHVKARWFEAVAGVRVKVWKLLYAGGTIRYKFSLRLDGNNAHVPYDILGWGLNNDASFGFNLYLSLRIPFVRDTLPSNTEE